MISDLPECCSPEAEGATFSFVSGEYWKESTLQVIDVVLWPSTFKPTIVSFSVSFTF